MCPWQLNRPLLIALLATGLLCITLTGGCPAPQTPTQPPPEEEESLEPPAPPPDTGKDRPIPIPEPDPGAGKPEPGAGEPGGQSGTSGGTGTGGTTGQAETIFLRLYEPFDSRTLRPPASVNVVFYATVKTGASIDSAEVVLARDDNNDKTPDGDPVFTQAHQVPQGDNTVAFGTQAATPFLVNGFGHFLLGVRIRASDGAEQIKYAAGTVTLDAVAPTATWVAPLEDHLVNRDVTWTVQLTTQDNSPHAVTVLLDLDTTPSNGNELELAKKTYAGSATRSISVPLFPYPPGDYRYYVVVTDGIDPEVRFYAPNPTTGKPARLAITNRVVGEFDLNRLTNSSRGAILQGFNFNDQSGSSMVSVPDMNDDGASELIIGARFGKPNLSFFSGQGWGEAYLIYGQAARLTGVKALNSVGSSIPGLTFRGIRVRQNVNHTEGLSDVAVVPDMDGDDLPELVFSFPRVESITLGAPSKLGLPGSEVYYQHPDLKPDLSGMGIMEYDAIDYGTPGWNNSMAQFTRGGTVIVSSHNQMLTNPEILTRKFDRVLDLHEIGQMFSLMVRPRLTEYIRKVEPNVPPDGCADCDPNATGDCGGDPENPKETPYTSWIVKWDTWLGGG